MTNMDLKTALCWMVDHQGEILECDCKFRYAFDGGGFVWQNPANPENEWTPDVDFWPCDVFKITGEKLP